MWREAILVAPPQNPHTMYRGQRGQRTEDREQTVSTLDHGESTGFVALRLARLTRRDETQLWTRLVGLVRGPTSEGAALGE